MTLTGNLTRQLKRLQSVDVRRSSQGPKPRYKRELAFAMKKVSSCSRSQVEFGRGLQKQLDGSGHALWLNADGPDAQTIEARLQLGTQDEGAIGIFGVRRSWADKSSPLIEAAVLQPGLQEAGRPCVRRTKMGRDIHGQLVATGFLCPQPTLDFHPDRPGVAHPTRSDVGEGDWSARVDETAYGVGLDGRQAVRVTRSYPGHQPAHQACRLPGKPLEGC